MATTIGTIVMGCVNEYVMALLQNFIRLQLLRCSASLFWHILLCDSKLFTQSPTVQLLEDEAVLREGGESERTDTGGARQWIRMKTETEENMDGVIEEKGKKITENFLLWYAS